jgi:exopolysaccharide biosynthesis predicted pyruvyltransferase EpsI
VLRGLGGDAPFALVDFPDHRNIGDSAIWLGAANYFLKRRGVRPSYVYTTVGFWEETLRAAVPDGPIFLHGGGNFGDLWPRHHRFRLSLLERFPDREIIQLPQAIHFQDPSNIAPTARAIARHGRLVLLVRDHASFEFATTNFECEVKLCPDMAFFLGPTERGATPDVDALYLMHTDKERSVTAAPDRPGYSFRMADWPQESRRSMRPHRLLGMARGLLVSRRPSLTRARAGQFDTLARLRTRRGRRLLSSGRVVITDRLHAHILSLLGIPHAVLDNSYGKLSGFLSAWTRDAAGVYQASSLEDAEQWVRSRLAGAT